MRQVKWCDFKITPLLETARKEDISDKVYFSKKYSKYLSNSRLKYINPDQGGSPQAYKDGITQESTSSLAIGSAVHQLFLQPDEFILVEGLNKPTAKLGQVIDQIKYHRNHGYSIADSINNACNDVHYYQSSLTQNRIKNILNKGFYYYMNSKELTSEHVVFSDPDTMVIKNCLNALKSNRKIVDLVRGIDWCGDPIESYNEDAMFIDVQVNYKGKSIILKLKMKADNWTIDTSEKILTLNDLKTTGKPVPFFMQDYGSFIHYHYARQMAMYSMILKYYCAKNYGYDKTWKCNSNMIVVETIPPYRAQCYSVSPQQIKSGMIELFSLLKRVAYHELCGYDKEVEFV